MRTSIVLSPHASRTHPLEARRHTPMGTPDRTRSWRGRGGYVLLKIASPCSDVWQPRFIWPIHPWSIFFLYILSNLFIVTIASVVNPEARQATLN